MSHFRFCSHPGKSFRDIETGACGTIAVPNSYPPRCKWHGGDAARKQGFVGVFARNQHPRAFHSEGYVVMLVHCDWDQELHAVIDVVSRKKVPEPMGHTYHWYGGWFEYIGHVTAPVEPHVLKVEGGFWRPDEGVVDSTPVNHNHSLGDYRAVIVVKAAQLLREIGRS